MNPVKDMLKIICILSHIFMDPLVDYMQSPRKVAMEILIDYGDSLIDFIDPLLDFPRRCHESP